MTPTAAQRFGDWWGTQMRNAPLDHYRTAKASWRACEQATARECLRIFHEHAPCEYEPAIKDAIAAHFGLEETA